VFFQVQPAGGAPIVTPAPALTAPGAKPSPRH
jgi:hypothetical protein